MNARVLRYDNKVWRGWVVAGVALLAAGLIACGGSDDGGSAEDSAMSSAGRGETTGNSIAPSGAQLSDGSAGGGDDKGGFPSGGAVAPESGASGGAVAPAETGSGSPQPIADVLGRQVIRNGSVELTVESVGDAFDATRGVVEQAGGYLSSSTFSGEGESERARMTVRVPAEKFDQVIADLRNLAIEVNSVSTSSQDVTEEFSDLEASLRNLQAVEEQYLTLLSETSNIGEILEVQDRLNGVRYELERVQGRLNLLENQTSLATLEIAFYPESSPPAAEPGDGFGARVTEAWKSSTDFLATAGTGIVVALVWSWWLIPVVLVGALVARRYAGRIAREVRDGADRGERVDTPEGAA